MTSNTLKKLGRYQNSQFSVSVRYSVYAVFFLLSTIVAASLIFILSVKMKRRCTLRYLFIMVNVAILLYMILITIDPLPLKICLHTPNLHNIQKFICNTFVETITLIEGFWLRCIWNIKSLTWVWQKNMKNCLTIKFQYSYYYLSMYNMLLFVLWLSNLFHIKNSQFSPCITWWEVEEVIYQYKLLVIVIECKA